VNRLVEAEPRLAQVVSLPFATCMTGGLTALHGLLGCLPTDDRLSNLVGASEPEAVKVYSDVVYYSYTTSGISLQYKPAASYKPPRSATKRSDLDESQLSLSTIDIYTSAFSGFPIAVSVWDKPDSKTEFTAATTGSRLVDLLGEPDRKGGGESRSLGVWLEWTRLGLMCEFSSIHGAGRWDKEQGAGSAVPSVWSIFEGK